MFSIVPFSINAKSDLNKVTIGDVTGSAKLLVPGRTTSAASIPRGATTLPIDPKQLCGRVESVQQIVVKTNEFGTIELDDRSLKTNWPKDVHWVRALRLSDDCHSCNIQLKLQIPENKKIADSKLILQAVRPIQIGEELLLWFSEDMLALIPMVFLTPANIQGQKKYVCTRCFAFYESPNPLKLHIVLNCGRLSISDLWTKLSSVLLENKVYNFSKLSTTEFTFKLTPEVCTNKQNKAIDLSTSNNSPDLKRPISQPSGYYKTNFSNSKDSPVLHRPYSEPLDQRNSAFKPFQKLSLFTNETETSDLQLNYDLTSQNYWSNLTLNQNIYNHNSLLANNINCTDEAHIETVVSSLGKSKEGHICLYCGKCYSRKYGLKIHIRTHTGYKPLKCKFCLRPFGDPSNLNKHIRLHAEGETPYKCELCGKILVRRRDLERHLKSRHMSEIHPGRNMVDDVNSSEPDITDDDLTVDR